MKCIHVCICPLTVPCISVFFDTHLAIQRTATHFIHLPHRFSGPYLIKIRVSSKFLRHMSSQIILCGQGVCLRIDFLGKNCQISWRIAMPSSSGLCSRSLSLLTMLYVDTPAVNNGFQHWRILQRVLIELGHPCWWRLLSICDCRVPLGSCREFHALTPNGCLDKV